MSIINFNSYKIIREIGTANNNIRNSQKSIINNVSTNNYNSYIDNKRIAKLALNIRYTEERNKTIEEDISSIQYKKVKMESIIGIGEKLNGLAKIYNDTLNIQDKSYIESAAKEYYHEIGEIIKSSEYNDSAITKQIKKGNIMSINKNEIFNSNITESDSKLLKLVYAAENILGNRDENINISKLPSVKNENNSSNKNGVNINSNKTIDNQEIDKYKEMGIDKPAKDANNRDKENANITNISNKIKDEIENNTSTKGNNHNTQNGIINKPAKDASNESTIDNLTNNKSNGSRNDTDNVNNSSSSTSVLEPSKSSNTNNSRMDSTQYLEYVLNKANEAIKDKKGWNVITGENGWKVVGNIADMNRQYISIYNDKKELVYQGDIMNKKANGYGSLYKNNKLVAQGNFENNIMSGWGYIDYGDGSNYSGYLNKGMREGWGTYTDTNNKNFSGDWKNNNYITNKSTNTTYEVSSFSQGLANVTENKNITMNNKKMRISLLAIPEQSMELENTRMLDRKAITSEKKEESDISDKSNNMDSITIRDLLDKNFIDKNIITPMNNEIFSLNVKEDILNLREDFNNNKIEILNSRVDRYKSNELINNIQTIFKEMNKTKILYALFNQSNEMNNMMVNNLLKSI